MKRFYVLWTYAANYSALHEVQADSPQEAVEKVTGFFSGSFHTQANVYVWDLPPVIATGPNIWAKK